MGGVLHLRDTGYHGKNRKHVYQAFFRRHLWLILAAGLVILLFTGFRAIFIFAIFLVLGGVLNYFLHTLQFHIHLGHVSFLSVVSAYSLGFQYALIMILGAHILPEILAGHADPEMIITASVYLFISFIAASFNSLNIVILGIGLTILQGILAFSLGRIAGTPLQELITEDGAEFVLNMVYFVSFSVPLVSLIK